MKLYGPKSATFRALVVFFLLCGNSMFRFKFDCRFIFRLLKINLITIHGLVVSIKSDIKKNNKRTVYLLIFTIMHMGRRINAITQMSGQYKMQMQIIRFHLQTYAHTHMQSGNRTIWAHIVNALANMRLVEDFNRTLYVSMVNIFGSNLKRPLIGGVCLQKLKYDD